MVYTYDESVFLKNSNDGDSYRPKNFAFIIIYSGIIRIEVNGVSHIYQKGSVLVMVPKKVYKTIHCTEDLKAYVLSMPLIEMRKKINFNFSRYDIYQISNADSEAGLLYFSEDDFHTIRILSAKIFSYSGDNRKTDFKEEICIALFSAISYIISGQLLKNAKKQATLNSRKEDIAMRFLELCSSHCKTHKELDFYAGQLLISIKYLSNCVREITNTPPTKLIADALINEAKILLLNSGKTIRIIADELGFADQYTFGKFFKAHTGFSPKNFKIQNKLINTF